jgi:hypothetical protein
MPKSAVQNNHYYDGKLTLLKLKNLQVFEYDPIQQAQTMLFMIVYLFENHVETVIKTHAY